MNSLWRRSWISRDLDSDKLLVTQSIASIYEAESSRDVRNDNNRLELPPDHAKKPNSA